MTEEELGQLMREIYKKIEAENPFETFEPHPGEENYSGFERLMELYDARLERLTVEQLLKGSNEEAKNAFMKMIADQAGREGRH
jgi:hypothetical protein